MKKLSLLLLIILTSVLFSCKKEEIIIDDISPFLRVSPFIVELDYLDEYDLMSGVEALDNIDGDLKDKVIIDDGGFNNKIAGEYEITYYVTDSSNNTSIAKRFIIIRGLPVYKEGYNSASIYLGKIVDEVEKPETLTCFQGSWSVKAESSFDKWLGIEGIIVLPEFEPDPNRYDEVNKRYLDNPSIYMGGMSNAESDAGLILEIGCDPNGCNTMLSEKVAYRPFWRYIYEGKNTWANADGKNPYLYYFPGDIIRMSVFSPRAHRLQLKIEVIKPTEIEKYVKIRESYGVKYPHDFLSPEFGSMGHGMFDARFKRVNAIDTYGNEGKKAQDTNAYVGEAIWKEVYLYRKINDEIYKIPFTKERYYLLKCPHENGSLVHYDSVDESLGGEVIIINPSGKN